ncbi:MAG TPA: hypothetical protein PLD91_19125 [Spirochaetota bacterium]|nr:hypothetical protein [Spirochaetota bacterium]
MKPYVSIFNNPSNIRRRTRVSRYHKQRESMNRKPIIPPRYIPLKERLDEQVEEKHITPVVQNVFVFNFNGGENIEDLLPGILKCINQAAL